MPRGVSTVFVDVRVMIRTDGSLLMFLKFQWCKWIIAS